MVKVYVIESNNPEPYEHSSVIDSVFTDKTIAEKYVAIYNELVEKANTEKGCAAEWYLTLKEVKLNEMITPVIDYKLTIQLGGKYSYFDINVVSKAPKEPIHFYKGWDNEVDKEVDKDIIVVHSTSSQQDAMDKAKDWLTNNGYNLNEFHLEVDIELL